MRPVLPPCVACGSAPRLSTDKLTRRLCVGCLSTLARVKAPVRSNGLPKPTAPSPPRPSFWQSGRERRKETRLAALRVRQLARRRDEAKSVLALLVKSERPRGVETQDTIRRWLEWDDADQRQQEREFLDDLALLYPDADDDALRALADRFRVRPPSRRSP